MSRQDARSSGVALCALATLAVVAPAAAEPAPPDTLVIGMSAALTGPSGQLGLGMKRGIEAYFAAINATGGVAGKKLRLIALDDGYEPARAAANMHRLVDDEHVFALLGNAGSPTAAVAVPIAAAHHTPYFAPLSGAMFLRKTPPERYVINFRASYAQETAEMIRGITELGIKPDDIAFFTQNDAFGDAGYGGAIAALQKQGYRAAEQLPHARYPRNTVDVEGAVATMLDPAHHPRAIIMIGAYKPCAKFIKLARGYGLRALFVNVSFVIGDALLRELGDDAQGVVVTQVVPPLDADLPAVAAYRLAVPAADRGVLSLEGFLAASAFVDGLRRAGPGATPDQVIDALEAAGPLDLGLGEPLQITPERHQLSNRVWPTIIDRGQFRLLGAWSAAAAIAGLAAPTIGGAP